MSSDKSTPMIYVLLPVPFLASKPLVLKILAICLLDFAAAYSLFSSHHFLYAFIKFFSVHLCSFSKTQFSSIKAPSVSVSSLLCGTTNDIGYH